MVSASCAAAVAERAGELLGARLEQLDLLDRRIDLRGAAASAARAFGWRLPVLGRRILRGRGASSFSRASRSARRGSRSASFSRNT